MNENIRLIETSCDERGIIYDITRDSAESNMLEGFFNDLNKYIREKNDFGTVTIVEVNSIDDENSWFVAGWVYRDGRLTDDSHVLPDNSKDCEIVKIRALKDTGGMHYNIAVKPAEHGGYHQDSPESRIYDICNSPGMDIWSYDVLFNWLHHDLENIDLLEYVKNPENRGQIEGIIRVVKISRDTSWKNW